MVHNHFVGYFLVSCPARVRLPARNGLVNEVKFLGLIPKKWKDQ